MKKIFFFLGLLYLLISTSITRAEERTALIIGNGSYNETSLKNPAPTIDPEEEARRLVKDNKSIVDIRFFLNSWPSGRLSSATKFKLSQMERDQNAIPQNGSIKTEEKLRKLEKLQKDKGHKLVEQEENFRIKQAQLKAKSEEKSRQTETAINRMSNKEPTQVNLISKPHKDSFDDIFSKATKGDKENQRILGWKYEKGEGVTQDTEKAVEWLTRAITKGDAEAEKLLTKIAEQGNAGAQYSLGQAYFYGRGVSEDKSRGIAWVIRAAVQGHSGAQLFLGDKYEYGLGVPMDKSKALEWLKKSAQQGDQAAKAAKVRVKKLIENRNRQNSSMESFNEILKKAEGGDVDAQQKLGWMYEKGEGVTRDRNKALEWFEKAAMGQ